MDISLETIPAGEFKAKCLGVMENVHESGKPVFGLLKGTTTIQGNLINPLDEKWDAESVLVV